MCSNESGDSREEKGGRGFNKEKNEGILILLSYFVSIYSVQLVKRSVLCTKVQRSAIRAQCGSTIYLCFDIKFPIVKKEEKEGR